VFVTGHYYEDDGAGRRQIASIREVIDVEDYQGFTACLQALKHLA
jgi:hypothetical protein